MCPAHLLSFELFVSIVMLSTVVKHDNNVKVNATIDYMSLACEGYMYRCDTDDAEYQLSRQIPCLLCLADKAFGSLNQKPL